jgi:hypothetical protein
MKKLSRRASELGLKFYEIAIESYAENDGWTAAPSERSEKLKVPKSLRSHYLDLGVDLASGSMKEQPDGSVDRQSHGNGRIGSDNNIIMSRMRKGLDGRADAG